MGHQRVVFLGTKLHALVHLYSLLHQGLSALADSKPGVFLPSEKRSRNIDMILLLSAFLGVEVKVGKPPKTVLAKHINRAVGNLKILSNIMIFWIL